MFSLVDPTETNKVVVATCQYLWEYVDFGRDVESILDISAPRNTLSSRRNMDAERVTRRERYVHTELNLSDDSYVLVFMPIRIPKRNTSVDTPWMTSLVFSSNKFIEDKIGLRIGSAVDTTDYISCVFVKDFPENVYMRNDINISGREKLDVKS